jgi:hypothetical protein
MTNPGNPAIHSCILFLLFTITISSCDSGIDQTRYSPEVAKVILDTDFGGTDGDIDDMVTMALAHGLVNLGECDLLAIMSCLNNNHALQAIDVVNTYYGRGRLPIGHADGETIDFDPSFAYYIASNYKYDLSDNITTDATALYRRLLSEHPDTSVVIVTVGNSLNIHNLMKSGPDTLSGLTGMELITRKVKKFHMMGGKFPGPNEHPVNFFWGGECVSKYVIENCPRPIFFNGVDIGDMSYGFIAGSKLNELPDDSPVKACYRYWFQHPVEWYDQEPVDTIRDHHHWDQIAFLTAVRGTNNWFNLVSEGHCTLDCKGSTLWKTDQDKDHHYMTIKMEPEKFSKSLIEPLMMSLPK